MVKSPWIIRIAWAAIGLFWFLWLGLEDRDLGIVILLAVALAAVSGITLLVRRMGDENLKRRQWLVRGTVAGLMSGAAVSPIAAVLMLLKIGLHAHPVPEFSTADLIAVLGRTPVWVVVGLLAGLAGGLVGGMKEMPTPSPFQGEGWGEGGS
ncbi:MAG: hypothetical protein GTO14_12680 [Anaerolineales bacterium]|nr:hypothetical protein [Anaerolineales bacterium]